VAIVSFSRRGVAPLAAVLALTGVGLVPGVAPAAAATATTCHNALLPQQRTEVDADLTVPQFDPALGTLLSVSVPSQTAHLVTDAQFQNIAQSAVVFSEDMQYTLTFTSPDGLASPPALVGMIQRIPSTTLAPFSGTENFQGPSAVSEPTTTRDASATPVSSTDPAVLGHRRLPRPERDRRGLQRRRRQRRLQHRHLRRGDDRGLLHVPAPRGPRLAAGHRATPAGRSPYPRGRGTSVHRVKLRRARRSHDDAPGTAAAGGAA
jgi:hypothetical protein